MIVFLTAGAPAALPAAIGGVASTHARIGHATVTRTGTVTASGETAGFPATAAANALTYDRWLPDALPATWQVDAGAPVPVDYVGIAAHTLFDGSITVEVEHSANGADWTSLGAYAPLDNAPLLFLFEEVTARYWRIALAGTSVQYVGVVYMGQALAMQRPLYGGHGPLALSRATEIRPQSSEGGQFLGRSIVRRGYATRLAWSNLTAAWVRSDLDPFIEDALRYPFFLGWRPASFPEDVGYVWTADDIAPSNQGKRDLMSVAFAVQGLGIE